MNESVKILYHGGEGEITEKRSRFIATTHPVRTEQEAMAFVDEIRKKYYDARHNCYAYVLGEDGHNARMSDDGEPSQTAGLPILNVLRNREIVNACIVVTRYFGGTLLGTGGLFRAYTKAAEKGLEASVIMEKRQAERWKIEADYSDLGRIQNVAGNAGLFVMNTTYTEKVEMDLLIPQDKCSKARALITEKTGARVKIARIEKVPFGLMDDRVVVFEEEALAIPKN